MSRFNVALLSGREFRYLHFLFDPARMICDGLEELGHSCTITRNQLLSDRVNILVAAHTIQDPAMVRQIAASGVKYIVLQSEVVRERQVNLTGDRAHFEDCYLPLMKGATAVWEGIADQVPVLAEYGVRALPFRSGWQRSLERVRPKRQKDIDFLFFGSVSEHRRSMLQALKARGQQIVVTFDAPAPYRDDLIARAKVHLAPRRASNMGHLAYGRILYLAANRAPVVVERCADQGWLEDCFVHAPSHEWVDLCLETLARPDLDALGEQVQAAVRRLPLTQFLEQLLDDPG